MANNGKYSYSKVDCYKQCPFKFMLKYIDGHYINAPAIALDVGNLIHGTEETIANCIKNGTPIDYVGLKNNLILETIKLEHKFPKDFCEPDKVNRYYKEKLYYYIEEGIYRLEKFMKDHPTYEIVGAEVPFKLTLEGKPFSGKIDRLIRDTATGKYICHDVKTYPVAVEKDDLTTPLQFVVYVEAIKEMYKVNTEDVSCGYDLPFCNLIQDAGTSGFVGRGHKKIKSLLEAIDAGEFEPNPTPLCYWCEFSATNPNQVQAGKNLCPYHSLWTKQKASFEKAAEWRGLAEHGIILENYIKNGPQKAV